MEQTSQVIHHHITQGDTQVSVHQVQSPSGSGGKRHQIIIDLKQNLDINATRSLAESVMESLGARSAAVYIENSSNQSNDLESLTTVNVIVTNDYTQVASPQPDAEPELQEAEQGAQGNRIDVDRIELTNASATETATTSTVSITSASTTASGNNYSIIRVFMCLVAYKEYI